MEGSLAVAIGCKQSLKKRALISYSYLDSFILGFLRIITQMLECEHYSKEDGFLRNGSPSLGLSDHFPGSGILNYRSDRDWSLGECYFRWCYVKIDPFDTMSTPITSPMVSPNIGLLR